MCARVVQSVTMMLALVSFLSLFPDAARAIGNHRHHARWCRRQCDCQSSAASHAPSRSVPNSPAQVKVEAQVPSVESSMPASIRTVEPTLRVYAILREKKWRSVLPRLILRPASMKQTVSTLVPKTQHRPMRGWFLAEARRKCI